MPFPAPRFDYDSLATPGGVGQGLSSLAGAIINARATQNKANAEQGLARVRQERDARQGNMQQMEFDERARSNRATEQYHTDDLALREKQGLAKVQPGGGPKELAQIEYLKSMTEKNRRPPVVKPPHQMSDEARVGYLKLLQQAEEGLRAQAMTSPDFKPTKNWGGWGSDTPAKRNLEAELADLQQNHPAAIALRQAKTNQQAPAPVNAAPAGAGDIRARVSARFGGQLPPDWEQSVMEAEGGDPESLQQLEEMLSGGSAIAQPDGLDLLGQ